MGRALQVGYVVEGSVRRSGGRVKVSVRLVNADDGFGVWGDAFERPTSDLLALQEQIAREVATKVAGQLLPDEQASLAVRPTRNAEASKRFLRGNHFLAQRNAQSVARAIEEYEAAAQLDTLFTLSESSANIEPKSLRSNAEGVVSVPLAQAGKWYIKFINMTRVQRDTVDYESKWATLTFQVR